MANITSFPKLATAVLREFNLYGIYLLHISVCPHLLSTYHDSILEGPEMMEPNSVDCSITGGNICPSPWPLLQRCHCLDAYNVAQVTTWKHCKIRSQVYVALHHSLWDAHFWRHRSQLPWEEGAERPWKGHRCSNVSHQSAPGSAHVLLEWFPRWHPCFHPVPL